MFTKTYMELKRAETHEQTKILKKEHCPSN